MTTLASITTELRAELKDTDSAAYRWTDTELARHIRRAVVEYSRAAPREMKTLIATTSGSRDITISGISGYDDLIRVLAVEFPVSLFPPSRQRFQVYNGVVTMLGERVGDGGNAAVYWGSNHLLVDGMGTTNSIPEKDHETVLAGAAGYAAIAWATYAVNRVNLGGDATPRDLFNWGNSRLRAFNEDLRRLRSRVRVQRLYAAADQGANSQTTDWGP